MSFKRTRDDSRVIRRLSQTHRAADAVGDIYPGIELFALTKGDFSLISIIETLLNQTGTADVVIGTWTAANAEIKMAAEFLNNGNIRSLLFVVDRSFPTRQPAYYRQLIQTFGTGVVRMTRSHCKFVIIRNDQWDIVVRTSMNLNENRRVESFEISDCKPMADYLYTIVNELFDNPVEYDEAQFETLGSDPDPFPGLSL